MDCEENNQFSISDDYHFHQLSQQQQIDQEKDIYFDCAEQSEEIFPIYHPWISEISLSVHRKTNILRRFLNYFNRSKRSTLPSLANEFVRIYNGHFNYPIGFCFHISYAKEKWLLILNNIQFIDYPIYPYPSTRIILIRKGFPYISR